MTRESACFLQHSLVLHLHPCPLGTTSMARIWKQQNGLVSFSASYKMSTRYIPLLCKLAHTLTCRRGRRLRAASPSLALSSRSFCSNDLANHRWKWRYGAAPSNGTRWGKPGWHTKLSERGVVDAMHDSNGSWQSSRLPSRRASHGAGIVHIPTSSRLFGLSLLVPYSRSFV